MKGPLWSAVVTFGGVLIFVAVLTRLTSTPETANTITAGFGAMTNIFKGAFRG